MTTTSNPAPITKTGMQGFLLWFKREQPALYNKIAPQIPKVAPKAFSNYTARRRKLGAIYRSKFSRHRVGIAGFGDYSLPAIYVSAPSAAPITVNYTAQLSASPLYASSPSISTDYYSSLAANPLTTSIDTESTPSPVATAANTGVISSATASAVGALIGAAATVAMTNNQAAVQQQAVNTNLQRAAAGLPPLNTSLNALGVPTVTGSTTDTGTLLLFGGGALLLLMLMGGSKSASV